MAIYICDRIELVSDGSYSLRVRRQDSFYHTYFHHLTINGLVRDANGCPYMMIENDQVVFTESQAAEIEETDIEESVETFAVWGEGVAESDLVREGEDDYAARAVALQYDWDVVGDKWAVLVECRESRLDAATRHDPAVRGYTRMPHRGAP